MWQINHGLLCFMLSRLLHYTLIRITIFLSATTLSKMSQPIIGQIAKEEDIEHQVNIVQLD